MQILPGNAVFEKYILFNYHAKRKSMRVLASHCWRL